VGMDSPGFNYKHYPADTYNGQNFVAACHI